MQRKKLAILILAAGKGTRMNSSVAKVLHPVLSRPMLGYVLDTSTRLNPSSLAVVVGHQADRVRDEFADPHIQYVEQTEQLGTGHAVMQAEACLKGHDGDILILCGDMPLLREQTLKLLLEVHAESGAKCTLLTLKVPEPRDFGRIVRDDSGNVIRIVENRDATEEEKTIDEYNAGVYCFEKDILFKALGSINPDNAQGEYYLTDAIRYLTDNGLPVKAVQTTDGSEILGINSIEDLKRAERLLQERS